jgi:putative transposase
VSEKYSFIDAEKAHYPVVKMCAWLQVSTSGFYAWRDRPASPTARRRARLARLVQAIFDGSDGTYGYRRIHAALRRQGEDCGPELVRDLMRDLGLVPCQPRPWRPTTTQPGEASQTIPDLVGRDFTAAARAPSWSRTSRICRPGRASATWPPSSTAVPKNGSDTRSPTTCAPSWSSRRSA